uniref:GIN domain-containing protein n=1 Tax=Flavobacterium macrobrachii TaxID=591204 RepID=UPI0037C002D0
MVKFIIFCSKAIIATVAGLLLTSCNWTVNLGDGITGSGTIVKETRKVDTFTKVEVKIGINCEIKQADNFEVLVEADDNVIKEIKTRVENGKLIIESDFGNYHNATRKVTVTMPKIDNLETSSGATLKSL